MSTKDPLDPFQDSDRTIIVPNPGGRRPQAPNTSVDREPLPSRQESTGAGDVPEAALKAHGIGLNPLVGAANPLLDMAVLLRSKSSYNQVENLRTQLVAAVKKFERDAKAALIGNDAIAAARFSLCTFLDESISSTPWGGGGVWASKSLLVSFHNEASGGEKFFLILQKLCQDPRANIQNLELMYLCLALGLEGRYRIAEGGKAQLDMLRERLHQMIQKELGPHESALSVHWQGAQGKGESLWRAMPVWVVAAIVGVLLVLIQLTLSFRLSLASDPVFDSLHKVNVDAPSVPLIASMVQPVNVPVRVAGFLANEIERGLVSVTETADRSTITLHGDGVFASGSAEVKGDYHALLQKIGDALKPVPGKVLVIGHTDDTKGFSVKFPSNWDLSKGRAEAVLALLAERAGPVDRYRAEGRGDTEPLVANDSAANRARNRRVGIIVLTPASH